MDFKNTRVLLTDGGGRQTLSILYGLKKLGCHVTVIGITKLDVCNASHYPDVKIVGKGLDQDDAYIELVMKEVSSGKYDVLFPVSERITDLITRHEEEIGKYVRIACAKRSSYIQAHNKQMTFDKAMDAGIPCPVTRRDGEDIEAFLDRTPFPIIIKPRSGVGSIGFHKMDTREDFYTYIRDNDINVDEYVVQECIHFTKRRSAFILMDGKGNAKTAVAAEIMRWYPLDAGTAICVRTVNDPVLLDSAVKLLAAMDWHGFANVSFMVDETDGCAKLLEINGRINASVKICFLCGCNVSEQLLQCAYNEEITAYPPNDREGLCTRHFHADVLWFLKSKDRFKSHPSWFSWKNTKDVVFSIKDPLPFFAYSIRQLKDFRGNMKKRKH